jgi:hypothetical protein
VTVLSLPGTGTEWVRRGCRYWRSRALQAAWIALPIAVQLLAYRLVLTDQTHLPRFSASWWAVLVFGLLATAEGLRVGLRHPAPPFAHLLEHPNRQVRKAFAPFAICYVVAILLLAPGAFLATLLDALRPAPRDERAARADLDAQLLAARAEY